MFSESAERLGKFSRADRGARSRFLDPRHGFIHARVVLHGARAERIHPEINRVVPADSRVKWRMISISLTSMLPRSFFRTLREALLYPPPEHRAAAASTRLCQRTRFFEDQTFVLIDVGGGLARRVLHRTTSSTDSSLEGRCGPLSSAANFAAMSIALRVVSSVQHHKAACPSSG